MLARTAKLAIATFGVAAALAAMSGASAAQDGAKPASDADLAAQAAKGKDVFVNYGCGGCHSLADAGATGHVGPSFDGDSNLTQAFVENRVTNGQGGMPAFGDQMSKDEIAAVAAYVTHAASK
jgi:mono/diheme cytochrome c family protein